VVQLHERALLDAGHVGPADAEFLGDFPLRPLFSARIEAETADHHFFFAFIENVQVAKNFAFLDFQLHFVDDFVGIGSQDID